VLTFFGFMHGEAVGFNQTPMVAIAYLGVAAVLFGSAYGEKGKVAAPLTPAHKEPVTAG
jgi:AGZA family xanthine/uracil permease-like MFS transporter